MLLAHSNSYQLHLSTLAFRNCFSPMIRVLSTMSLPGPAATQSSFCVGENQRREEKEEEEEEEVEKED